MDIICGKCGIHFSSIESAREHSGHCRETSKSEAIHWLPSNKSKLSKEEWDALMRLVNLNKREATNSESKVPQTPDLKEAPKEATKALEERWVKPEPISPMNRIAGKNEVQKAAATTQM